MLLFFGDLTFEPEFRRQILFAARRPCSHINRQRLAFQFQILFEHFRELGRLTNHRRFDRRNAAERDDPRVKERAFAEATAALQAGEIVGIFPEGRLTDTGELNPFRAGVSRLVQKMPVPVVPMALRGLWGSFFSRTADGKAMRRWRGMFSRIGIVAAPPVPADRVNLESLHAQVLAMRGDAR